MQYRREIDGLRAVAVVPVILFHAGAGLFGGGYVGVDIFFVISGYLITGIILADIAAGRFSIAGFYERRARRILPALFAMIVCCLPAAWWLMSPAQLAAFGKSIVAVVLFVSNLYFWQESGYFAAAAASKPLLHTWSLAVEEQYYLLFPPALALLWRFGRRVSLGVVVLVALASLGLCEWASRHAADANFYLAPTRVWELLAGSLCAFVPVAPVATPAAKRPVMAVQQALALAGLGLIGVALLGFDAETRFPSLYALLPVVGTALVVLFARADTLAGRLLGTPLLVGIGLVSYSAYLWHQPLFAFARIYDGGAQAERLMPVLTVLVAPLAWLSWKFVEQPFRNRQRFDRRTIFRRAAVAGVLVAACGLVLVAGHGFVGRFSPYKQAIYAYDHYDYHAHFRDGSCFIEQDLDASHFDPGCVASGTDSVLLWGDSHAAALSLGLRARYPALTQLTASACPPLIGVAFRYRPHCRAINDHVLGVIARQQPRIVFLHGEWLNYGEHIRGIDRTVAAIALVSPGSRVIVIASVPQWKPGLPSQMVDDPAQALHAGMMRHDGLLPKLAATDAMLARALAPTAATIVYPLQVLCRAGDCLIAVDHAGHIELTAWDNAHLTAGGALYLAQRLFP